jgi:putative membrane protein
VIPLLHPFSGNVSLLTWYPDPAVLFGVLALGFLYRRYTGPKRDRFRDSAPVESARVASFFTGLAVIVLALLSPLGVLADDYWLSAHMVQHLLLTLIVPPALLWGVPVWMIDAARRNYPRVWRVWRYLTRPVVAFLAFHVPFAFAHFPFFYDAMLDYTIIHAISHEIFIVTALLVWWPIVAPGPEYGRLSAPLQILYFFAQTIPGQLVGAILALADTPIYAPYANAPRVLGVSVMADQQLGGLIMWIVTGTVYLGLMAVVFFRWASAEDRAEAKGYAQARNRPAAPQPPPPAPEHGTPG